jgi:CBS domain-containing protein
VDARLSDEQQLLAETAGRLAAAVGTANVHELPPGAGTAATHWEAVVDAGLVGLGTAPGAVYETTTVVEAALVVAAFGRALATVPLLGQGVLAPALAPAVLDARRVTVALDPTLRRLARVGEPGLAVDALGATGALVLDDEGRPVVVELADDVRTAADLTRRVVALDPAARRHVAGEPLDAAARTRFDALALVAATADLVGVAEAALDAAVAYVADRRQFGVAVGTFQAVQHLAADAKVRLEGARSSLYHGAWAVDVLAPDDALEAARQAKAYGAAAGRDVVETATQLLGGIAITWEELMHLRVRRALFDRALFGDEHHQYEAIAASRLGVMGV